MQSQPWDQRDGESAKAYRAFLKYRDLGTERSLGAAYAAHRGRQRKSNEQAAGCWLKWSSQFQWPARAQAWDAHEARIRDEARAKSIAIDEKLWAQRRAEVPMLEYGAASLMLKIAAEQMEKGRKLTNVSAAIEVASKLMRRACKLPVEIEEHPPDNFRDLFFESSGEVAAAIPASSAPEMPVDVTTTPRIDTGKAEAGRDAAPRQPPKPPGRP